MDENYFLPSKCVVFSWSVTAYMPFLELRSSSMVDLRYYWSFERAPKKMRQNLLRNAMKEVGQILLFCLSVEIEFSEHSTHHTMRFQPLNNKVIKRVRMVLIFFFFFHSYWISICQSLQVFFFECSRLWEWRHPIDIDGRRWKQSIWLSTFFFLLYLTFFF